MHEDRLGGIADGRGSHSMLMGGARAEWVWLRRPICQEPEEGHGDVLELLCIGGAKARLDQPLGMARTSEGLRKGWGGPRLCSRWDPSTMGVVRAGQEPKAGSELVGVPRGGWPWGDWEVLGSTVGRW